MYDDIDMNNFLHWLRAWVTPEGQSRCMISDLANDIANDPYLPELLTFDDLVHHIESHFPAAALEVLDDIVDRYYRGSMPA